MINNLRSMAIFATVVEQGSFRAAAKHLSLAPSRISQAVSDLENELGVTLLYRSTRQLTLTQEGQVLLGNVQTMMQAAESGIDAIVKTSTHLTGEISVTAPEFISQTGMMDVFTQFLVAHPDVTLRFNFSDHAKDLIAEGYDVAIRAGDAADSELMSRTIGESKRLLVASPLYAAQHATPTHPENLRDWHWLQFSVRPSKMEFTSAMGVTSIVPSTHRIEVDSANALYEFARRGMGLTPLPERHAVRGIARGDLVHVLPDWSLKPLQLQAIWPDRSRRESLSLMFVRFLADKSWQL